MSSGSNLRRDRRKFEASTIDEDGCGTPFRGMARDDRNQRCGSLNATPASS
jgi:hypothetical protein